MEQRKSEAAFGGVVVVGGETLQLLAELLEDKEVTRLSVVFSSEYSSSSLSHCQSAQVTERRKKRNQSWNREGHGNKKSKNHVVNFTKTIK